MKEAAVHLSPIIIGPLFAFNTTCEAILVCFPTVTGYLPSTSEYLEIEEPLPIFTFFLINLKRVGKRRLNIAALSNFLKQDFSRRKTFVHYKEH